MDAFSPPPAQFGSPAGYGPPAGINAGPTVDPRQGLSGYGPPPGPYPPGYGPPGGAFTPHGYVPVHPGPPKQKSTAGILAILLGSLGVHLFYLGQKKWGLIFLLGTIFTCGVGLILTTLISIVQGVRYLCASDEEFYQKYVVQQRLF